MPGVAILFFLALTACTSEEPAAANETSPTISTSSVAISTTIAPTTSTTGAPTTTTTETSTTTSQPPETVPFEWPPGTVTCAEIEGNFPVGVDDHGVDLDRGLISYFRSSGADRVEEIFIQFLDDPTCTSDSEAWKYMIGYILIPESLYGFGLCDFYRSLPTYSPPPANLDTVLTQLATAEQLCN
ncbi:MAG TPA: hypothetical protein ENG98_03575 [Actinobacteria bacterium]|nr:hypothetical protein [Actinomycetota bacterium]